jgi:hypothetical protein
MFDAALERRSSTYVRRIGAAEGRVPSRILLTEAKGGLGVLI